MNSAEFEVLAGLVKARAGIMLREDKTYLLQSRLMPLVRRHGLKDLSELAQRYRSTKDERLASEITEAMTTNESLFFRDTRPFDLMRDRMLPGLTAARGGARRIRIWCAACSAGQEPYSIAMMLKENQAKFSGWRFEILATDIAQGMIAKAQAGIYSQFEVQRGLPVQMLVKYFHQSGDKWQIDSALRSMVTFRQGNLLEAPYRNGTFDIIFCRNVLIYFDPDTKAQVLGSLADSLASDGMMMLGAAETVRGFTDRLVGVPGVPGLYQRADGQAAIAA